MEDNEMNEVIDETIDEGQEEVTMAEETNDGDYSNDTPTLEDFEALQKKLKTIEAQKEHWRKKAETKSQPLKTNETQPSSLSREEAILFAKGYTEEEVDLANKLAKVNGTSILVAVEDNYLKSLRAERLRKERSEKAALPASNGAGKFKTTKPIGEMSEDEHREYFNKVMGN